MILEAILELAEISKGHDLFPSGTVSYTDSLAQCSEYRRAQYVFVKCMNGR